MFVTDGYGKSGGNVMSKNRSGNYVRNRITPTNPQSTYSQPRRSYFQYLASSWRSLSSANIILWNAATINYPRTDRIGNIYYPSGFNLYIELNLNLFDVEGAYISAPPVKVIPTIVPISSTTFDIGGALYEVDYGMPLAASTDVFLVFATRGLSAGRSVVTSDYRLVKAQTWSGQVFDDFYGQYSAKFPPPSVGSQIFTKLVNISTAGSQSIANLSSTIVF